MGVWFYVLFATGSIVGVIIMYCRYIFYKIIGSMQLPFLIFSTVVISILIEIRAAPSYPGTDQPNENKKRLEYKEQQLEDEDVQELKNLKSTSTNGSNISMTKTQKTYFTNVNGKKEQINKNGKFVRKMERNEHFREKSVATSAPYTRRISDIEIMEHDSPRRLMKNKYEYMPNKFQTLKTKTKNKLRYQPEDMAEYIHETGDEKAVTNTIENYLQSGLISSEEALWYLQQIKVTLELLEEQEIRDRKKQEQRFYEDLFGSQKNRMDVNQVVIDLNDIQQLVQQKLVPEKTSIINYFKYNTEEVGNEEPDSFERFESDSEKADYKYLAGWPHNFENTLSRTSMEGVIYQLAKILFYQSLSPNGFQTQDTVKQFTLFLENQVEKGHISRSIERKVLDILLSALTDTLNEHPEIVQQKPHQLGQIANKKGGSKQLYNTVKKDNNKYEPVESSSQIKSTDLTSSGIQDEPKRIINSVTE